MNRAFIPENTRNCMAMLGESVSKYPAIVKTVSTWQRYNSAGNCTDEILGKKVKVRIPELDVTLIVKIPTTTLDFIAGDHVAFENLKTTLYVTNDNQVLLSASASGCQLLDDGVDLVE
ncbi:MAG: hypothetical protein RR685_08400 [Hungatella sp.]